LWYLVKLFRFSWQVWIYEGGRWVLFKEVMKKPLGEEYLAIGTTVALSLRKLPHSANSQLRYQVPHLIFEQ
jgi:hypothetical protein